MKSKWTVMKMRRLSSEDVIVLNENLGQLEESRYWHLEKHKFASNQDFVLNCLSQGYDLDEITGNEWAYYKENRIL